MSELNFSICPEKQKLDKLCKQPYRLFYYAFTPRTIRKQRELAANLAQQSQVAQDWRKFLQAYFGGQLTTFNIPPKKNLDTDKIIWQYWGQGFGEDIPPIVRLCFASIDQHKGDYQVIRLCDKTIYDYLDLPEFVWQKRKNPEFKHAFFADLLRLALLKAYGGIWADATILLTAPIDSEITKQDFFMFGRNPEATGKVFWQNFNSDYFGWHKNHHVNILNSFIVAKKDDELLNHCFQIMLNFWQTQNNIPHYFFFQIMYDILTKEFITHQKMMIDDTLPHLLISKFNTPFNNHEYHNILTKSHIHKLTYVKQRQPKSYYDYLYRYYLPNN